jgi:type IV secretory pathway VirD2 relaxase
MTTLFLYYHQSTNGKVEFSLYTKKMRSPLAATHFMLLIAPRLSLCLVSGKLLTNNRRNFGAEKLDGAQNFTVRHRADIDMQEETGYS